MSATIEYRRPRRGLIVHAVVAGERAAVCGAASADGRWSTLPEARPTCPACRRKLGMGPLAPPRAEGGTS